MVAEFVARQHSGSPVNGETPNQNHTNSNMPGSHLSLHIPTQNVGTTYMHDNHGLLLSGQLSPNSPDSDNFSPGYDIAAHLKRKELFTQRKQREFIPDNKKDDSYWDRRRRNNEAAKRSREKRRFNDMVLEQRVVELTKENHVLKAQLEAIKDKYNICGEHLVSVEQIMATLPTNEQVLSITKRAKLSSTVPPTIIYPQSPSPVPTSVIHQTSNGIESPASPPQQQSTQQHHQHNNHHHLHHYTSNSRQSSPNPIFRDRDVDMEQEFNHQMHHHSYPVIYNPTNHKNHELSSSYSENNSNVLNLSRRPPSPYEISSGTGSGTVSGDDEPHINDTNNSLPLKLRHKSHLGDKDAATALLALQHIKQEPGARASPPWDCEGSSDERDSGISICTAEWTLQRKLVAHQDPKAENHQLKSKLAKLESEVATIKNMMILNTTSSTAAAQ